MKNKTGIILDLAMGAAFGIAALTIMIFLCVNDSTKKQTCETAPSAPVVQVTEPAKEPVTLYAVPLDDALQLFIIETAEAYGIDPAIVFAMAFYESTYRADVIGGGGSSYGLLQVQPYWHWERMMRLGCDSKEDLLDPYKNVLVAVDYLAEQIARYDGDVAKGLTAYNLGHYAGEVTYYAKNVLAMAEEIANTSYEVIM